MKTYFQLFVTLGSWTGRTLKDTGALAVWHESLARVTVHSNRAIEWAQTNVPKYTATLNKSVGPYVEVVRKFLATWFSLLWESLLPVRKWFKDTLPPLIDHVCIEVMLLPIANNAFCLSGP